MTMFTFVCGIWTAIWVYDFVNFWDDTEAAGDELDFEWINEQLKK